MAKGIIYNAFAESDLYNNFDWDLSKTMLENWSFESICIVFIKNKRYFCHFFHHHVYYSKHHFTRIVRWSYYLYDVFNRKHHKKQADHFQDRGPLFFVNLRWRNFHRRFTNRKITNCNFTKCKIAPLKILVFKTN